MCTIASICLIAALICFLIFGKSKDTSMGMFFLGVGFIALAFNFMMDTWYIGVIVAIIIVALIILVHSIKKKRWYNKYYVKKGEGKVISKSELDHMEGHRFEYFCADLLRMNGFTDVNVTQGSGDQGVDIVAEQDGVKYAIQVKRYSETVGNAAVQAVFAGAGYYGCTKSAVLTNNQFTTSARQLASHIGVELWGRGKLFEMISSAGYMLID